MCVLSPHSACSERGIMHAISILVSGHQAVVQEAATQHNNHAGVTKQYAVELACVPGQDRPGCDFDFASPYVLVEVDYMCTAQ